MRVAHRRTSGSPPGGRVGDAPARRPLRSHGGHPAAAVEARRHPSWVDLLARIERVDRTGEHFGAVDLEEELANPEVVVGKDFVGAFDGPDMVGYYSPLPRGEAGGHFMIHVEGSVVPARRGQGIGTLLVAGMVEGAARARGGTS